MTINNDVREAISKNLPQTIGEELRKRLDQADRDAKSAEERLERIKKFEATQAIHLEKIRGYEAQEDAVKALEADVINREKEITRLELVAQYEEEKRDLTVDLFKTVFANRIVRESATVQRPYSSTHNDHGTMVSQESYSPHEESKETEEG